MIRLLFVCMGNICRSPLAEGAFKAAIKDAGLGHMIGTDSAGTIGFHEGKPPDRRGQAAARRVGLDIGDQRARKVRSLDFQTFDHIFAMDSDNLSDLEAMAPMDVLAGRGALPKLSLFLDHAVQVPMREMPDPYYGTDDDFDRVCEAAIAASGAILTKVRTEYQL